MSYDTAWLGRMPFLENIWSSSIFDDRRPRFIKVALWTRTNAEGYARQPLGISTLANTFTSIQGYNSSRRFGVREADVLDIHYTAAISCGSARKSLFTRPHYLGDLSL